MLEAVPKPEKLTRLTVSRRGCLVFSAKGRRPIFDGAYSGQFIRHPNPSINNLLLVCGSIDEIALIARSRYGPG